MKTITNPDDDFKLEIDDVVILIGPEDKVALMGKMFGD
jgi:K+/H+ antiporter YhaU regulatory subunit KhtT